MKKTLTVFLLAFIMCSCASMKSGINFEKSVWSGPTVIENDNSTQNIVTSLYFKSSEDVDIYKAVVLDTSIVVKPFKYAIGKYTIVNKSKKDLKLKISGKDIQGQPISYDGFCYDGEAMLLVPQNGAPIVLGKNKEIRLP